MRVPQIYFPHASSEQSSPEVAVAACLVVVATLFTDKVCMVGNGIVVSSANQCLVVAPAHLVCRENCVAEYVHVGILPGSRNPQDRNDYCEYAADVVRTDQARDLALLRIEVRNLVTVWEVEDLYAYLYCERPSRWLASIVPFGVPTIERIPLYDDNVYARRGQSGSAVYSGLRHGWGLQGMLIRTFRDDRPMGRYFIVCVQRRSLLEFLLEAGYDRAAGGRDPE